MTDDNLLPFSFPAIHLKKITAAFDGGRISSDEGNSVISVIKNDALTSLLLREENFTSK
jgi:hypothetical protein